MLNKTLTLTIVIPAYNEQSYLRACLNSIAAQSEAPDEVIMIDNNSTDNTVEIAKNYPFVKVLSEPRQHQVFAQQLGFNAARGDLIGRIDADTVLPQHWVKAVKQAFAADNNLAAIKGTGHPYDVYSKVLSKKIFQGYNKLAGVVAGHTMLWGANCVLRNSHWQKVKDQVLLRNDIWEDYDLAFCLAKYGKIEVLDGIEVGTSFRAVHKSFFKQFEYQFRSIRTFYLRRGPFLAAIFGALWVSMAVFYPIAVIDHYFLKPLSRRIQKKTFTIAEALEGLS